MTDGNASERRVFLHGWGQSPACWRFGDFSLKPSDLLLALPGHGGAEDVDAGRWLDWLEARIPRNGPLHLVGWSLGAMLAMALALRGTRQVARLSLYAATPSFVRRENWPHGVAQDELRAMLDSVASEDLLERGLARFTRLMLHGEITERAEMRRVVARYMSVSPLPTVAGLQAGGVLLATLDLRAAVSGLTVPVRLWHGVADAVVPVDAGRWLARKLSQAEGVWLDGVGHMPWAKAWLRDDLVGGR